MTQETLSSAPAGSPGRASPGERLAQARAQRGLTAEQVARETNLSLRYVQALEQDDYDVLPGPAFIRGYLRRYAQLVHLSPDTLVAVFDELWNSRAPVPVQQAPLKAGVLHAGGESLHVGKRPNVMAILSGAVVVLLVAGSLFWNSGDKSDAGIGDVTSLEQDMALPLPAAVPVTPAVTDPALLVPPAATQPGDATLTPDAATPAEPAGPNDASAPTPAVDLAATESPRPAVVAPRPATPVTTVAPAPAATPSAQGSVVIPAAPAPAGPRIDTLGFTFTGRSWISVRDATGQELVYGLKNQGQVVAVTGQPPFSINIGNVKATALSRNGQPVNLKPYTRGEIASFRLSN